MAVGASACCLGPLLLLSLGIGGVWISHLSVLERYRAPLIVATLVCIGFAFRQLYLTPRACAAQDACAVACAIQPNRRLLRLFFWILTPILLALLASNQWIPLLYR